MFVPFYISDVIVLLEQHIIRDSPFKENEGMERIIKLYELLGYLPSKELAYTVYEDHLNSYLNSNDNDREKFIRKIEEMQQEAEEEFRVKKYLDNLLNLLAE